MPKRIFIGGLSAQTTEKEVTKMFSQAGTVLAVHLEMPNGGNSQGHGYVEMSTDKEALTAINELNGQELNGSRITVQDSAGRESSVRPR